MVFIFRSAKQKRWVDLRQRSSLIPRLVPRRGNVNRRSRGDLVIKNCWLGLTLLSVPRLVFGLADGSGTPPPSLSRWPVLPRERGCTPTIALGVVDHIWTIRRRSP